MTAATNVPNLPSPSQILAESKEVSLEVLARTADETDRLRRFPRRAIEELGKRQILGLMVPREFEGASGSLLDMALVLETLAQGCASTAMIVLMHYCATAVLVAKAPIELKRSILPTISRGEHLSTLAFSEVGSGAHFQSPISRASQKNGNVELNAVKSFATSAEKRTVTLSQLSARRPPGHRNWTFILSKVLHRASNRPASSKGLDWQETPAHN